MYKRRPPSQRACDAPRVSMCSLSMCKLSLAAAADGQPLTRGGGAVRSRSSCGRTRGTAATGAYSDASSKSSACRHPRPHAMNRIIQGGLTGGGLLGAEATRKCAGSSGRRCDQGMRFVRYAEVCSPGPGALPCCRPPWTRSGAGRVQRSCPPRMKDRTRNKRLKKRYNNLALSAADRDTHPRASPSPLAGSLSERAPTREVPLV